MFIVMPRNTCGSGHSSYITPAVMEVRLDFFIETVSLQSYSLTISSIMH